MKVGNLVRTSYRSKRGVGVMTRKRKNKHMGDQWTYRIVWADGSIVFHTRGTLEVISEKR
jgi:hypothetical protein